MIPIILFLLSIGLQVAAAVYALLLVRTTGRRLAWLLLSLSMVLMAWRRAVSFSSMLTADKAITFAFPEYIALIISVLMLMGVVRIGAYFRSIRKAEEERDKTMEALLQEKTFTEKLLNAPLDTVFLFEPVTGKPVRWNKRFAEVSGYKDEEIACMKAPDDFYGEDDLRKAKECVGKIFDEGQCVVEMSLVTKLGARMPFEYSATAIETPDGKTLFLSIGRDMTERRQTEKLVRDLSLRQEAILDAVPDIIMEVDNQKVYTWANKEGYEFFGEDVIGKQAAFYFEGDQDTYASVEPVFKGAENVLYVESWQRRKDGEKRLLAWWCRALKDESGDVKGVLSTARDITEYRKLEAQYLHAQKMEAVGTLAGGVAHDFNNILSAIIGYGDIALMKMSEDDPKRLNIENMLEAADRAAHLTKDLLLFSRKQVSEMKPVDLNDIITKVEKFLMRVIGEDIECNKTISEQQLTVFADSHHLEQVLMNLATNARDAMPKGGTFTVLTEKVFLDEGFTVAHGYGKPGPYAMMVISDTGKGIEKATLKRIFEPFFTTKKVGKGTGLGLSVVYGIIKQHDGFINVYSEPGKGTTFRIYLPLISTVLTEETMALQEEAPARGSETVLVAEDDEALRKLSSTVLTHSGYTVIEAVDGEDAVRKFMENRESIKLLLFDIIMPKMNGKQAYDEIQKIEPDIKVIFASGYAPDLVQKKVSLEKDAVLIYKPIRPYELLSKVREVLDKKK